MICDREGKLKDRKEIKATFLKDLWAIAHLDVFEIIESTPNEKGFFDAKPIDQIKPEVLRLLNVKHVQGEYKITMHSKQQAGKHIAKLIGAYDPEKQMVKENDSLSYNTDNLNAAEKKTFDELMEVMEGKRAAHPNN